MLSTDFSEARETMAKVLLLYNEPVLPDNHPDAESERDLLHTVDAVHLILKQNDHQVTLCGLRQSPEELLEPIRQHQPEVVFNLFEGFGGNPASEYHIAGLLEHPDRGDVYIDSRSTALLSDVERTRIRRQDIGFVYLMAGREAGATVMRGFTTVRDTGGPVFGLKLAIDQGAVSGPRIFPSGAMLSQTSGHGDFRLLSALPRMPNEPADYTERTGVAAIADGRDEVLRRTREQLMKGASQIKIMAGGGVSLLYDPLNTAQYTLDEMRAAVEAAADWGTYVCAHVYTPAGILRCIEAGVKSIEHGQLADAPTIRAMAEAGIWWSIQPFLADEDANPKSDPRQQAKQMEVADGTVRAFEMGRAEGVKMAFGTDVLFNPGGAASQGRQLAKLTRFMAPLEALRMATGAAGQLLAMSGERAPYQGQPGVIAEGALALNIDPVAVRRINESQREPIESWPYTCRSRMQCHD